MDWNKKKIILRSHGILNKSPNASPNIALQVVYQGGTNISQKIQAFAILLFYPLLSFFTLDYKSLLVRILHIFYYNIENQTGNKLVSSSLLGSSHGPESWYAQKGRHQWPSSFLFQRHILVAFFLTSKLRYLVKVRHMFKLHVHLFLAW